MISKMFVLKHKIYRHTTCANTAQCLSKENIFCVHHYFKVCKHRKVPDVSYMTNMTGLARLKCSSLKALWVSGRTLQLHAALNVSF